MLQIELREGGRKDYRGGGGVGVEENGPKGRGLRGISNFSLSRP